MKKTIIILLSIPLIVFTAIGIYLYNIFFVGGYLCDSIFPENISVKGNTVKIDGITGNSALTFRDHEYFIEGNKLYIKLRYVLVSKFYPDGKFNININDANLSEIECIYFTNKKNKKMVWSTKYIINNTMQVDEYKFLAAQEIILEKTGNLESENNSKLRVCYEESISDNVTNNTYMLLDLQRLSDYSIIGNYLLNINTLEIYEGNFDIDKVELVFNKKIN